MRSAWEGALGARVDELHPRIREYVRAIPVGSVGRGSGVFTEAGCRSAILRPVLRIAARFGVAFPEHGVGIPFTIENRGDAQGGVRAIRTLRFPRRERVMLDRVHEHHGYVVDALGADGRLEAAFRVSVRDAAMVARSGAVRVRLGRLWWRLPRVVRPCVDLVERWDDAVQRQHVDVRVSLPIVGAIYGYHGWFDYAVVGDEVGVRARLGE